MYIVLFWFVKCDHVFFINERWSCRLKFSFAYPEEHPICLPRRNILDSQIVKQKAEETICAWGSCWWRSTISKTWARRQGLPINYVGNVPKLRSLPSPSKYPHAFVWGPALLRHLMTIPSQATFLPQAPYKCVHVSDFVKIFDDISAVMIITMTRSKIRVAQTFLLYCIFLFQLVRNSHTVKWHFVSIFYRP